MKRIATSAALVAIAVLLAGAVAQALSPTLVFEGNTTTRDRRPGIGVASCNPETCGFLMPVNCSASSLEIIWQDHASLRANETDLPGSCSSFSDRTPKKRIGSGSADILAEMLVTQDVEARDQPPFPNIRARFLEG